MRRLAALLVVAFADMVGFTMVFPLVPLFAEAVGASGTSIGVVIAAYSVTQFLSAPVWGRLSDRHGRRPILVAGFAVSALAYAGYAFADSVETLVAARLLHGVGGGIVGVIQASVADVSTPAQRTQRIGWLTAATSLGAVIGPALGAGLASGPLSRTVWLAAAGLSLAVSLLARLALDRAHPLQSAAGHAAAPRSLSASTLLHLEPPARLIWIYGLAVGAAYGLPWVLPLLMTERFGAGAREVAVAIMYLGAMGFVLRVWLLGRLAAGLGEVRLLRGGLLLLALACVTLAIARGYPVLALALTLLPLGMACVFPSAAALLTHVTPAEERGAYLGLQQTVGGVSRTGYPVVAAMWAGGLTGPGPFVVALALLAVALVLALPLRTPRHDEATDEAAMEAFRSAATHEHEAVVLPPRSTE